MSCLLAKEENLLEIETLTRNCLATFNAKPMELSEQLLGDSFEATSIRHIQVSVPEFAKTFSQLSKTHLPKPNTSIDSTATPQNRHITCKTEAVQQFKVEEIKLGLFPREPMSTK